LNMKSVIPFLSPHQITDLIHKMKLPIVGLPVGDRIHNSRKYHYCFLASEGVDWMLKHSGIPLMHSRLNAIAIYQLLMEKDELYHVANRCPYFIDGHHFYAFSIQLSKGRRMTNEQLAETVVKMKGGWKGDGGEDDYLLGGMGQSSSFPSSSFEKGFNIGNHRYLLTTYPNTFVGSEACEWMIKKLKVSEPDAVKLGQVLLSRGIIVGATGKYSFRNNSSLYSFQNRGICCGNISASPRSPQGTYPADSWRPMWCVLVEKQLQCFPSSSDPHPLYVLDLYVASINEGHKNPLFAHSDRAKGFFFFEVQTEEQTLGFQTKSQSELNHWLSLLQNIATSSFSENEFLLQAEAKITSWTYKHSSQHSITHQKALKKKENDVHNSYSIN